jgi:hypothetical protein
MPNKDLNLFAGLYTDQQHPSKGNSPEKRGTLDLGQPRDNQIFNTTTLLHIPAPIVAKMCHSTPDHSPSTKPQQAIHPSASSTVAASLETETRPCPNTFTAK